MLIHSCFGLMITTPPLDPESHNTTCLSSLAHTALITGRDRLMRCWKNSRPLENSADFEQFKKIIEIARALKLTPGSKHGNDDYRIEGTVPLSNLFNCLTPLENKTAEDMLFALKTICPDIHDWDIVIGALLTPACQPRTFQKTLSRLATASDLPSATAAGNTTTTCPPTLSNEHV